MNLLYTPRDIAAFLNFSNFTQSDERLVLNDIWEDNALIQSEYRKNKALFKRHVYAELSKYGGGFDIGELKMLSQGTELEFSVENETYEQAVILRNLKTIKLGLNYTDIYIHQFEIKFRNLLKAFGYKRRSAKLVENIKTTLSALELKTYSKENLLCDIANINLDDIIMIRLAFNPHS